MLYWQRLLIVVHGTESGAKREGLKADADMAQAEARALLPTAVWQIMEVPKHVSVIKFTIVKYYWNLRSGFKTITLIFFQKDANNFFVLLSPSLAICAKN